MSLDPADQEYFADGMAEELINALTQVPGLRVTARTSVGRRLGVRTIVEERARVAAGSG